MTDLIGQKVQNFYNETPFPDYDLSRFSTEEDLKVSASSFARILDRSIPENASVIDVGTGTGQLSAFLSIRRENVWGIDFSTSSLAKANDLKEKLNLTSWTLKQVDILDMNDIRDIGKQFDYVLCLGVLHHTRNAYLGFKNILPLLKPRGYIAIGLYNSFGRMLHKNRQLLAKTVFKDKKNIVDWFMKMQLEDFSDSERKRGWWHDQYLHPHETTHTVGEALSWFRKNDIEFYQTIPTMTPFSKTSLGIAGVWNKTMEKYPYFHIRTWKQFIWIWKTHKEGGYWITFGRKR